MPSADVNLAAQSSPGNTWETGRLVRFVDTWSSLSMRMFRGGWTEPERCSVLVNMMNSTGDVFIGVERGEEDMVVSTIM